MNPKIYLQIENQDKREEMNKNWPIYKIKVNCILFKYTSMLHGL